MTVNLHMIVESFASLFLQLILQSPTSIADESAINHRWSKLNQDHNCIKIIRSVDSANYLKTSPANLLMLFRFSITKPQLG